MRTQLINLGLTCLIVLAPSLAWGQFGIGELVYDPTNWLENSITAASTAETLLEAIDINLNTALNIASLEEIILQRSAYLEELAALGEEAVAIGIALQRVSSQFGALFGTESLPVTMFLYELRRSEIYGYKTEASEVVYRVLRFVSSTVALVERVVRFIGSIGGLVGGKQATLTVLQAQLETLQAVQRMDIRQIAMDNFKVIDRMDDASAIESLRLINKDAWKNWPGQ